MKRRVRKPRIDTINAMIEQAELGFNEKDIFTFIITLDTAGKKRYFGGIRLDTYDERRNRCVGTALGLDMIMQLMRVAGARTWDEMVGRHVRVKKTATRVLAIGHFVKDQWFDPIDVIGEFD